MIHARRIKPKKTSTKDMLQNTVNNTVSASTARADADGISEVNARDSKARAFDAAFGKSRPFNKISRKGNRSKTNNRVANNNSVATKSPMRKLVGRLILLAIVCLLVFTFLSMSFRTKEFLVEGNSYLDTSEVQMLSKIYAGTPLLWLTDRNVKNLLRNPWIDNVKINRVFPHTVLIKLSERTPVAVLSNDSIKADRANLLNSKVAYAADGVVLPNVPVGVLEQLTTIDGWGEDRSLEGLELLNYFATMPELKVTKINYTPEGFEASFEYGLQELQGQSSNETSFILGQLQTPSLTLLKEHEAAFVHALATSETGELRNMAGSLEGRLVDKVIVAAPLASLEQAGVEQDGIEQHGIGQDGQETRRIVKRKWITVYGWGVSLSE